MKHTEKEYLALKQELELCREREADYYAQLCDALQQLQEAGEVIKLYADTVIGYVQSNGTCRLDYVTGTINFLDPNKSRTAMNTLVYDPRPAKDYLKKYKVVSKEEKD